jgi:hypothetical protein
VPPRLEAPRLSACRAQLWDDRTLRWEEVLARAPERGWDGVERAAAAYAVL